MTRGVVPLKVGVAVQDSVVRTIVEGFLDQLGVDHTPSDLEQVPCIIDARRRPDQPAPSDVAFADRTVHFDDFMPIDDTILALQGRLVGPEGFFIEPTLSVKAKTFFDRIRESFFARGLPLVAKAYWPGDAPGCLVLTHDIDWLRYSPLHKGVKRGKSVPRYLGLALRYALGRQSGYNIDSLIALEAEFGVKSTFLFRTDYASENGRLRGAVQECQASGCEVALHAAKKSHKNPEAMVLEKTTMEKVAGSAVLGLREHALKFDYDKTWRCIEGAGLRYDMTFGLNEKAGFIAGLSHPYHPLGTNGEALPFLEIPTSFMDWTAIHARLDYAQLETLLLRLTDVVTSLNGCMCVNFHNTYVDRDLFPDVEKAYRFLLSRCKASGFWIATARDCAEWWIRREQAVLGASIEGGSLRLESRDPLIQPKVYWPDGRVEPLVQAECQERH